MGLIKFYQEMYGTIIYFFSFFLNERYKGQPAAHMSVFIISNCICEWPCRKDPLILNQHQLITSPMSHNCRS